MNVLFHDKGYVFKKNDLPFSLIIYLHASFGSSLDIDHATTKYVPAFLCYDYQYCLR